MTKEELEKEAEVCMHNALFWLKLPISKENVEKGSSYILELLEPREKRIEELEKEIERITVAYNNCVRDNYYKTLDLEKENAELKNRDCWKSCEYANPKAELIGQHIKDVQNLTKAKDLLLRFIELKNKPCAVGHSINMLLYDNICAEIKQFLNSEVEK